MTDLIDRPSTVPIETVTKIKPSEAIRLGCLVSPPRDGKLIDKTGASCALGAMLIGAGWQGDIYGEEEPYNAADEMLGHTLPIPESEPNLIRDSYGVMNSDGTPKSTVVIYRLNDSGWSRERIADWLEGLGL